MRLFYTNRWSTEVVPAEGLEPSLQRSERRDLPLVDAGLKLSVFVDRFRFRGERRRGESEGDGQSDLAR